MRIKLTSVLIALTAMTAACGSDDGSNESSSSNATGDTPPTDADVDRNGTLRYATFFELSRFDPHLANSSSDEHALFLAYDRLIHLSPELEPQPGLAESWAYRDGGRTLELTLRRGVTFHDGAAFDASAAKANLERAMSHEQSTVASDLSLVTSIESPDDTTLEITMSEPQASLLPVLSGRAGAMISPAAFEDPELASNPVGTGMYRVTEYRPGDRIIYERYDDYWDPDAAGVATIEYLFMGAADARLNALRNGEIDVTHLDADQIEEAEEGGLQVETRTTLGHLQIYMNRTREPFTDVRVRQALNYAIDRHGIVEAVALGYGAPNSQMFPEGYWAFNDELGAGYYMYDPDRARALLAEAGFADGLSFELLIPVPGLPAGVAEILQQQFADVGVDVTLTQTPTQNIVQTFFIDARGDALLGFSGGGRPDPSLLTGAFWTAEGASNPGGHSTDEIERLHRQALTTVDPDRRAELMDELVAAGTENAFDIVIYDTMVATAATNRVARPPVLRLDGTTDFRGVTVRTD